MTRRGRPGGCGGGGGGGRHAGAMRFNRATVPVRSMYRISPEPSIRYSAGSRPGTPAMIRVWPFASALCMSTRAGSRGRSWGRVRRCHSMTGEYSGDGTPGRCAWGHRVRSAPSLAVAGRTAIRRLPPPSPFRRRARRATRGRGQRRCGAQPSEHRRGKRGAERPARRPAGRRDVGGSKGERSAPSPA